MLSYSDERKEDIDKMIEQSSEMYDYRYYNKSWPRFWMNKSGVHLSK